jgi:hypothetical protein
MEILSQAILSKAQNVAFDVGQVGMSIGLGSRQRFLLACRWS